MNLKHWLVVLTIWIYSCGYRMGSPLPPEIRTLAVPIFQNHTLYRGYEFSLTQAVISELLASTSLRICSKEKAETILKGSIVKVRQDTVTKDENRMATQLDVTLVVEIEWKDQRTGKALVPKCRLSETVEIITNRGQTFSNAMEQALRKLARSIVYTLEDRSLIYAHAY